MFEPFLIGFANYLENNSRKIKKFLQRKRLSRFITHYSLSDAGKTKKTDIRFNPYECINLYLIDELAKKNIIDKSETIIDIGCGTGLFLISMAEHGYSNSIGVEIDKNLYNIALKNIQSYQKNSRSKCNIIIHNINALEYDYDDSITCFYLFNTFYDKSTYDLWLDKIEESLHRKSRKIKIIILYPTVASMGAMRGRTWLHESDRVVCKAQSCYNCVYFIVYSGELID